MPERSVICPDETVELRPEERQPCEVWTRVMGYHRPVSEFNLGKKAEHAERLHFEERPRNRAPGTALGSSSMS